MSIRTHPPDISTPDAFHGRVPRTFSDKISPGNPLQKNPVNISHRHFHTIPAQCQPSIADRELPVNCSYMLYSVW